MVSAWRFPRLFGWSKLIGGGLMCLALAAGASAQETLPSVPPLTVPAGNPQTVPAQPAQANQPANPEVAPPVAGQCAACPASCLPCPSEFEFTLGETTFLSIFNKHAPKREWTPLYADTFFSDGWLDPHIGPPSTTGGSVRQGWVGLNDVFFNRMIDSTFNSIHGINGRRNAQIGAEDIETPISRRLMIGVIVPYVVSLNGNGQPTDTGVGDTILESRIIITETKDLTITANLNFLVPTGSTAIGNNQTAFIPYLGWYKDLGYNGWSFRGLVGIIEPLSGPNSSRAVICDQTLALGQTLTKHDVPLFGDFTYYMCVNTVEAQNTNLFLSLTPGIRTHLGRDWYFLAGVEVPVTANAGFSERFNIQLVKGF